jgi:hypothetical protein
MLFWIAQTSFRVLQHLSLADKRFVPEWRSGYFLRASASFLSGAAPISCRQRFLLGGYSAYFCRVRLCFWVAQRFSAAVLCPMQSGFSR